MYNKINTSYVFILLNNIKKKGLKQRNKTFYKKYFETYKRTFFCALNSFVVT